MSQDDRETSDWHSHAAELAEELRRIGAALAERDLASDDLAEAAKLARSIRQRLEGPSRPRWYDADEPSDAAASRAYLDQSPIRGRLNPVAPPLALEFAEREGGRRVVEAHAHLGRAYEGPPHGVHGGWVAALFDEVLGATQGPTAPSVTATLKVRYRAVTPIEQDLRFEGWIHEERGARTIARATCHAGQILTADAEGLFVRVDFDEIERRMKQR